MNTFSTWLTGIMLVIFTTMVGMATQWPEGARMMPLVVGIPGIMFCLIQLMLDAARVYDGPFFRHFQTAPKAGKPTDAPEEMPEFGTHTTKQELRMWTYFVAFVAGLLSFGYYVSIPIMLVTFLRREAEASWRMALLLGLGATTVIYLLFGLTLRIQLFPGFLSPIVLRGMGL
jgi:Tripartite tricarboxylate transporter TctB family